MRRIPRRPLQITLAFIVVLLGVRAVLPAALQRYVNEKLDEIPGYGGEIGDVDLNLLRGAYEIEDVRIVKTNGKVPVPFFAAPKIDISLQWSALFDGALVGEVELFSPELNFVSGPDRSREQESIDPSWQDKVKALFPFRINRLAAYDGQIHFRDFHSAPQVNLYVSGIRFEGENITNAAGSDENMFAVFHATGKAMGAADLVVNLRANALADRPTFSLDGTLEALPIKHMNDFLRAYANVDAEAGTFELYTELNAENGRIAGYAKPFFKDVKILDWKKDVTEKNQFQALWEGLVEVGKEILESDDDAVASRIPLSGQIDETNPDTFAAIGSLLRNAFIEALRPQLTGGAS